MPLCLWIWERQWKRKSERTSVFGRKRTQIRLYLINHTITICSSSSRPKLKSMWWSPTCGHQQISHHCTHYQHASARPYFSWSQTFLLRKIILRLTECPLSNHLSVFIAQTYEKKLTLKLNITENSVKSLNALKKQHLSNTIFRWVGKRMFWH